MSKNQELYKPAFDKLDEHGELKIEESYNIEDFFSINDAENITFSGAGTIDGQGFNWWMREYIGKNILGRPKIFNIRRSRNFEFSGVRLINSPYYHIDARDID